MMIASDIDVFPDTSRVWVYTISRTLSEEEASFVQDALQNFTARWTAHNEQLKAAGMVLENSFIVLMVDESQAGASGCSIDTSVAFIKALGEKLEVDLFDRLTFAYRTMDGAIQRIHKNDMPKAYQDGMISDDSVFFNPMVNNKGQLYNAWELPLRESWHKNFL